MLARVWPLECALGSAVLLGIGRAGKDDAEEPTGGLSAGEADRQG
ncbi:hypothetical protein OG898_28245 [Streptomyces sp. NBC_00193]|nr:hypothetical protein [Streptomyces sp. NBC_00193]MCX5300327.1 hypothetical protein [Streptomyces sp. NBC_00193]